MRKLIIALLILFTVPAAFNPGCVAASSVTKKIIVIDAGHGGWDPGKVGKNKELEKDINLAIAEDLQVLLEFGGAVVFLTRAGDAALGDTKNSDLKARTAMPTDMQADIFISIHQNAYPNEKVRGAQAFYFKDSDEGKRLAQAIQKRIGSWLDTDNDKEAGANQSYYLLKKSQTPAVIIECGFFTNPGELKMLTEEGYQEKMAWAIYLGILDYFKGGQDAESDDVE